MKLALALVSVLAISCGGSAGSSDGMATVPASAHPMHNEASTPTSKQRHESEIARERAADPYGGDTYGGTLESSGSEWDEGVEGGVEGGVPGGVVGGVLGGVWDDDQAPPPPDEEPLLVPQAALDEQFVSGDRFVQPDDDTKIAIQKAGKSKVVGTFKMCVAADGHVVSTTLLKSTGYHVYDARLQAAMALWIYKPYIVNGKATPVCTAVTFIYKQV